ncbi:MAG TPA: hypothetical protein VK448_11665 [Dissulfurispiraceae bacterium]|nr:hypothetical protein [Dissulfurispiraceae bacterium]
MVIDIRGLHHPDHLKAFRKRLEGFCTVHEEVEVLMENDREDLRKFEMFIRSCRGKYTIAEEGNFLRVKIETDMSLCG